MVGSERVNDTVGWMDREERGHCMCVCECVCVCVCERASERGHEIARPLHCLQVGVGTRARRVLPRADLCCLEEVEFPTKFPPPALGLPARDEEVQAARRQDAVDLAQALSGLAMAVAVGGGGTKSDVSGGHP